METVLPVERVEVGASVDDVTVESGVDKIEKTEEVGEGVCEETLEGCWSGAVLECEVWEEGSTPTKPSVLVDVMLEEICDFVCVADP